MTDPQSRTQVIAEIEAALKGITPGEWFQGTDERSIDGRTAEGAAVFPVVKLGEGTVLARLQYVRDMKLADMPRLLRAVLRLLQEEAWQPIATAPKDGREIFLRGPGWARTGHWARRVERWSVDAAVRLPEPTHWTTLPPDPPSSGIVETQ